MRDPLKEIERVEAYLLDDLSEVEATQFKKDMESNADLKEQVDIQELILQSTRRSALRAEVLTASAASNSSISNYWKIGLFTAGILLGAYLFLGEAKETESIEEEKVVPEQIEEKIESVKLKNAESSEVNIVTPERSVIKGNAVKPNEAGEEVVVEDKLAMNPANKEIAPKVYEKPEIDKKPKIQKLERKEKVERFERNDRDGEFGKEEKRTPNESAPENMAKLSEIILPYAEELKTDKRRKNKRKYSEADVEMQNETPEYKGGEDALNSYLEGNMQFPKGTNAKGGIVYMGFRVDINGEPQAIKVLKGLGGKFDKEAMRLVMEMPNWNPGKQNGVPVEMEHKMPIVFTRYSKR
ncbi:MAG: energy transducer TonB [Flavobacteriales bacterium]|nr:energy transducer TonB [Flavobacteriales bacterium]